MDLDIQSKQAVVAGNALPGPLLVLGGPSPVIPGVRVSRDATEFCVGILLTGPVGEPEFAAALESAADPALPVADFADNAALRHDFVAPVADARSILDFCP
jgi:hypothetical protein